MHTQILGNVRYPILRIKTNSLVRCSASAACMATDIWTKSRLNWKLKISNAADNADITQSQTCRHVTLGIVECSAGSKQLVHG